jgi:hypothetical protein
MTASRSGFPHQILFGGSWPVISANRVTPLSLSLIVDHDLR